MAEKRKPVYIEREQRKALFQMLNEAQRQRASFIRERPDTKAVIRARRLVREFDARTYAIQRRMSDAIERKAKQVREKILFGSDVRASLAAVKRFRAQR